EETRVILADILQAGRFPAGRAELRADGAALKQITLPANAAQPKTASTPNPASSFPPVGNLAQVMRGILFPNSNIIFTVQTHDPAEKRTTPEEIGRASCRERVEMSVVADELKKKKTQKCE